MIILGKFAKVSEKKGLSPREIVVGVLFIDEPVVSHDKPGAADHGAVLIGMFC